MSASSGSVQSISTTWTAITSAFDVVRQVGDEADDPGVARAAVEGDDRAPEDRAGGHLTWPVTIPPAPSVGGPALRGPGVGPRGRGVDHRPPDRRGRRSVVRAGRGRPR